MIKDAENVFVNSAVITPEVLKKAIIWASFTLNKKIALYCPAECFSDFRKAVFEDSFNTKIIYFNSNEQEDYLSMSLVIEFDTHEVFLPLHNNGLNKILISPPIGSFLEKRCDFAAMPRIISVHERWKIISKKERAEGFFELKLREFPTYVIANKSNDFNNETNEIGGFLYMLQHKKIPEVFFNPLAKSDAIMLKRILIEEIIVEMADVLLEKYHDVYSGIKVMEKLSYSLSQNRDCETRNLLELFNRIFRVFLLKGLHHYLRLNKYVPGKSTDDIIGRRKIAKALSLLKKIDLAIFTKYNEAFNRQFLQFQPLS